MQSHFDDYVHINHSRQFDAWPTKEPQNDSSGKIQECVRYLWYFRGLTASQSILNHFTDGGGMVGSRGIVLMHYQLRSGRR